MPQSNEHIIEIEQELVQQCIRGDREAFNRLFDLHRETVFRVVYKLLGGSPDIDDAVQQTFIEIYKSLPHFECKSKFSTWLYRIAINVATQFLRKRNRRIRAADQIDPETLAIPAEYGSQDTLEKRETQKTIRDALESLDIKKRTVVVLHDMEERTMEEIAEITSVPLGTVKSRLFHGREELRKKLKRMLES